MPVSVACVCGWSAVLPDKHAGKTGTCPKCKVKVRVTSHRVEEAIPSAMPIMDKPKPATKAWIVNGNVAGVTFKNPDGIPRRRIIERLIECEPLKLIREPWNERDANAIAVRRKDGSQIGYVKSALAKMLAPEMDSGIDASAYVTYVGGMDELREARRDRQKESDVMIWVEMLLIVDRGREGPEAIRLLADRCLAGESRSDREKKLDRSITSSPFYWLGRALGTFVRVTIQIGCLILVVLVVISILVSVFSSRK